MAFYLLSGEVPHLTGNPKVVSSNPAVHSLLFLLFLSLSLYKLILVMLRRTVGIVNAGLHFKINLQYTKLTWHPALINQSVSRSFAPTIAL